MNTKVISCLFLLGISHTLQMAAQPGGAFIATGDMNSRRIFHTATLLTDETVLIAGGTMIGGTGLNSDQGLLNMTLGSAELYDPATGTFSVTGNMTTPRDGHTATLLPNGKVLIAGGGIGAGPSLAAHMLASAELYDPDTGTFSATGNMTAARFSPTATLLNNGKVLIAGGAGFLASAELYDPSTGTFTATGDMTSPWADTATLLPNGNVLITRSDPDGILQARFFTEIYDASTGMFSPTGRSLTGTAPTAILLPNGKVLVAGGDIGDGDGSSSYAELYDPASGTFAATGRMAVAREQHTATLLSDGTVLFAGGHDVIDRAASAEIFDPFKAAFGRTANMRTARELHTATLLSDGRVLMAGGDDERYWIPETILSSAELYTPAVVVPAPVLLSLSGEKNGQGAVWHSATGQIASPQNPAAAGEVLSMYTTSLMEGGVVPPQVAIGGKLAEILFFGDAPGYPGYFQVNFRVPDAVAPGSAIAVRLTYLGRPSNAVTIGVW
jgi:Galactose oxidase, central domain